MRTPKAAFRPFFATLLLACAAFAAPARAAYPDRPIHMVVPFPAGGPTDIVGRPFAQFLGQALGQSVIVDNRGGAGGSIGADVVAKSAPDGYTLLMGTVGTNAINGSLYSHLAYDPVKDFTPIALVASAPVVLVVNPKSQIHSVKEFIARAKAKPGQLPFGSAGDGTPGHLTGEMFSTAAHIKLQHIPYKGSAPAISDLLGNQIPAMFDPLQSVLKLVKAGKLKALAISSAKRSPELPDVPTFAESGLKGFDATAWWAVFAPANLPADVASKLRSAAEQVQRSGQMREKLAPLGVDTPSGNVDLAAFQRREVAKWGEAVRASGAKVD